MKPESEHLSRSSRRKEAHAPLSLIAIICAVAAMAMGRATAAEPTKAELEFFENKIRPILAERCYQCHSHESPKLKGGLSVQYNETLRKGGYTGPAVVPGDVEKSLLIKAVRYTD